MGQKRFVTVPVPVSLREMAGWDPVPLALIFSAAGMPLVTMIQLGLPPGAFLPPGCAPGDEVRLPLPNLDFDLMLVLMEVRHRRFRRAGEAEEEEEEEGQEGGGRSGKGSGGRDTTGGDLVTDVYLNAWHNVLKGPVRLRSICGRRVLVRKRGQRVDRTAVGGDLCTVAGFGMPLRSGGDGDGEDRGALHVRLHLRSLRDSVVRALLHLGSGGAAAALTARALLLPRADADADEPSAPLRRAAYRARPIVGKFGKAFAQALFGVASVVSFQYATAGAPY